MKPWLDRLKDLPWREHAWPIVFWLWVVSVSFWIEGAPVNDPKARPTGQAYSDIAFDRLRFEQLDAENRRMAVDAPRAEFNRESREFQLTQPELSWDDPIGNRSFSASGELGRFLAATDPLTQLPSAIRQMEITGNARAVSGDTTVETETVTFDNEYLLFEISGAYRLQKGAMKSASNNPESGIFFDPITSKLNSDRDELLQTREAQS